MKADVKQNSLDMEILIIPNSVQQGKIIKDDVSMKFYDETKPLYLKTEALRLGLGTTQLQTRDGAACPRDIVPDNTILSPIAFSSKSLTSTEQRYSNIKREALGILHGLERFCHYCFAREVSIITDHKPLVAVFKWDVVKLSQRIHCTLLSIHQFCVRILYKSGPGLFITDWFFRHNLKRTKTQIPGMDIKVDTIQTATNIPEFMPIPQLQQKTAQDDHLQ